MAPRPRLAAGVDDADPQKTWRAELKAAAAARGHNSKHILPLAEPEVDEDLEGDPLPPTLEQLRAVPVLICPRPVEELYEEILEQLGMVGRDEIDDHIRMLNTGDSYPAHDVVRSHLKGVDQLLRRRDWPAAFTLAAALLRAVLPGKEDFWYMDNDDIEEVEEIVERMDKQWDKLWARSAAELGGVTDEEREAVETIREEMLEVLKDQGYFGD